MSMTLGTIAKNGYRFTLQVGKVGIVFVVDRSSHFVLYFQKGGACFCDATCSPDDKKGWQFGSVWLPVSDQS